MHGTFNIDHHLQAAKVALTNAFGRDGDVFMAFSGGKESMSLLKLCEPYAGRFKLLWANPGFPFPHVEALIHRLGETYGLVEIPVTGMPDHWRAHGWPADAMTVDTFLHKERVRLQPWPTCCLAHKSKPILDYLQSIDRPVTLIHGQRRSDSAFVGPHEVWQEGNARLVAPLLEWSTKQVMQFIEAEGVELPDHYSEIPDSLDCWHCPAHWSGKDYAPAFAAMVKRRYPEMLPHVLPTVEKIHVVMSDAVAGTAKALELSK